MEPPKPPLCRLIREGTIGDCPICGSTTEKRFNFFRVGKSMGCIHPDCSNYKYNKQRIRLKKLKKIKKY